MIQLFLFIILLCSCVAIYILNGQDMLSPAFLFVIGFALCALSAVFFTDRWAYEMSPEVFGIVLLGVAVFVAVSYLCSVAGKKKEAVSASSDERSWILPVSKGLLLAFVVLEAVVLYWSMVEILAAFPAETIPGSISRYNSAIKFTDEGANIFYTPLSQLRSIVSMLGYVFAFYLAQSFVLKKNQGRWIQLLGLLLACALQLTSANRTVAAGYIFCFVLAFFILKRKLENDRPVIDVRAVFALVCVAVLFLVSFQSVAAVLQGRTTSSDGLGYLSSYIGAQLPNLDTFIQSDPQYGSSGIFGYMTFRNSIRWIGLQFSIPEFIYQYDLPFNTVNGVSTGNVYTTFYAFLYDYRKCKLLNSGSYSGLWVIVYTMVAYALILCFFSNKFYENIFTISMIYKIIYLLIIFWIIKYVSSRKDRASIADRRVSWRA